MSEKEIKMTGNVIKPDRSILKKGTILKVPDDITEELADKYVRDMKVAEEFDKTKKGSEATAPIATIGDITAAILVLDTNNILLLKEIVNTALFDRGEDAADGMVALEALTVEALAEYRPELVTAIKDQGFESGKTEGFTAGAEAERQKIETEGGAFNELLSILDNNISEVTKALISLDDDEIVMLMVAEKNGKTRSGVMDAIEAELVKRYDAGSHEE